MAIWLMVGERRFVVDVATMGDPQDVVSDVLWNEVIEHMIVPMSILLVLVLGATLLSVRQALKPVRIAADAAERIDPMDSRSHLQFQEMPREVAHLAEAVNRAFERVGELMKSQKILTSGIAHEVRTPLAAIKLELGHIDHPRARKAEADLDDLVRFVSQITALARLDTFDHGMCPVSCDRTPDRISYPDHAGSNATAGQRRFFCAHSTSLTAMHQRRNGWFAEHGIPSRSLTRKTAARIKIIWGCDHPTRRHAEESRP